jgi:CheY-like chemotaxis protein
MEDEGGTLEITLKDISIDRTTNQNRLKLKFGNYIELKVSDTGTGIESHVINKIFEPYFTTKKPGEGTGMGLALVHGIVEAYGGQMIVESTLGEGSVFTIYLPIAKGKSAPLSYKANELPTGQERILFVDDEAPIVKIASRLLGQLGYSVTTRTSSIDALELFKSNPSAFDLVISDVTMPQMTGDELTKKLIEIRPDIPVILCTGYSKRLSEEKGSEIGIQAFAGKPIVKEDLAKTVRDVLDLAKE